MNCGCMGERKEWGGTKWEVGINMHTLLYVQQLINNDPSYNTGNPTQYSVIIYMGKEPEKEQTYVYA